MENIGLDQQYEQTLQNTIGMSQRERNKRMAQQQGQTSNVPTQWQERGASGYRGAGFQEVDTPTVDANTRSFLGNAFGDYTEGGKNQAGYYGADNPYTTEGAYKLAQSGGFEYAPESLQAQFQSVGQNLPSIYGKSLANQSIKDTGLKIGEWQQQQKTLQDTYNKQPQQTNPIPNYDSIWSGFEAGEGRFGTSIQSKMDTAKQYIQAGFVPGQSNQGWKWNPANQYGRFASPGEGAGNWQKDNIQLTYDPKVGYTTSQIQSDSESRKENLQSMATVASVIGSVILPGLGTSWLGLLGDGVSGATGTTIPSLSSTSLGVPAGISTAVDTALGNALKSGTMAGLTGGNPLSAALKGAVSSGVSGLSDTLSNSLGSYLKTTDLPTGVSSALTDFAKGSSRSLASNLFGKNTGAQNLSSALASGLGNSLGGVYNKSTNVTDRKQQTQNYQTSQNLAKLFGKIKK